MSNEILLKSGKNLYRVTTTEPEDSERRIIYVRADGFSRDDYGVIFYRHGTRNAPLVMSRNGFLSIELDEEGEDEP